MQNDPEVRMKKQLLGALIGKFQEFSKEYQLVQVRISKASNERTRRQAKIIDKDIGDEEIDKLCENPEVKSFFIWFLSFYLFL